MKKRLLILLYFIITGTCAIGQIYSGNSTADYWCLLRINKDSSVNFIYSLNYNEFYGEHKGTIKKINDSLYHISTKMTYGKSATMGQYTYDDVIQKANDTAYFRIDTPYVHLKDTIIIKYANGQTQNYIPYKQGKHSYFALDKKLFNDKPGSNYYKAIIKRKNPITGQQLSFKVTIHSSPFFESGRRLNFDVIIKNNKLWTNGEPDLDTGQFTLNKG
ncbi:MAG: hypothetical protein ABR968_02050 [Bacteroidales bacterium]|jgi:hypothetical protein